MISTVGQHSLVDAAVIFKVGLTVTFQIRGTHKHRTLDWRLEKASRPSSVVKIRGVLGSVARGHRYLNRRQNGYRTHRRK
jgi:hypothetical protein